MKVSYPAIATKKELSKIEGYEQHEKTIKEHGLDLLIHSENIYISLAQRITIESKIEDYKSAVYSQSINFFGREKEKKMAKLRLLTAILSLSDKYTKSDDPFKTREEFKLEVATLLSDPTYKSALDGRLSKDTRNIVESICGDSIPIVIKTEPSVLTGFTKNS